MNTLKHLTTYHHHTPSVSSNTTSRPESLKEPRIDVVTKRTTISGRRRRLYVRGCAGQESGETKKKSESRRSFLSIEEAGLVEISGLSSHEKFLCRLTISSLNLLRVISEQEGRSIEELDAGRICDWFLKDKLRREQNFESAVLQWDDSDFQI